MGGRAQRIDSHRRHPLDQGWQLCATAPGAAAQPTELAALPAFEIPWTDIPAPQPAAAALRAVGRWSLDGPARRFDAHDWWYRTAFDAPEVAPGARCVLGFDGLATIAQVWLNGEPILDSDNMFVAHELDMGARLRERGNELVIAFRALDAHLAKRRPRPRWRVPMIENQQIRWARTTLLGRLPGWTPPAAVVGPWGGIWLEHRHGFELDALTLNARLDGSDGVLDLACTLKPIGDARIASATLEVERDGVVHRQQLVSNAAALRVPQVQPWWPHTHGEPALYDARLRVALAGGGERIVPLGRVGFRNITVDTADGDFHVRVNGVSVFCRGSCWMPIDPATLHASPEAYAPAIAQLREAGMNMIRLCGPTAYECDAFHDECDAQGVLVWQEFMFANMDYPHEDATFLATVENEVRQQLARLQGRASLAVLCGNSEAEQQAAMWGAPREIWSSPLFDTLFARWCAEAMPEVAYWPSSAHGGAFPHQANAGTTSFYRVGAYWGPLDDARRAGLRFATECLAFANVPPTSTLQRMPGGLALRVHHGGWKERGCRDMSAGWDFDDVRDHYLERFFGAEAPKLRYTDHDRYLALSRMASGEVMYQTFSEWRTPHTSCRGALTLFWRDLWAGAGWGMVDDQGVAKACWHYARQALQPVSVWLSDEGSSGLFMNFVNERAEAIDARLQLSVWRDGSVALAQVEEDVRLAPRSSTRRAALELMDRFMDLNNAYRFGPLAHDAVVATLRSADGQRLAESFYFPGGYSLTRERDLGLSAEMRMLDGGDAEVIVRTQQLAQAVHFELNAHRAEDEFFHLAPGDERRVRLIATKPNAGTPMGSVQAINGVASCNLRLAS